MSAVCGVLAAIGILVPGNDIAASALVPLQDMKTKPVSVEHTVTAGKSLKLTSKNVSKTNILPVIESGTIGGNISGDANISLKQES